MAKNERMIPSWKSWRSCQHCLALSIKQEKDANGSQAQCAELDAAAHHCIHMHEDMVAQEELNCFNFFNELATGAVRRKSAVHTRFDEKLRSYCVTTRHVQKD